MTILNRLLIIPLIHSTQGWSPAVMTTMRSSHMTPSSQIFQQTALHLSASKNEDDTSIDNFPIITKTNKRIVFNEKAGRFFETSTIEEVGGEGGDAQQTTTTMMPSSAFSSNEMIPTEILFGKKLSSFQKDIEHKIKMERSDYTPLNEEVISPPASSSSNNDPLPQKNPPPIPDSAEANAAVVVKKCYSAWNSRDMTTAASYFSTSCQYDDSAYLGTINDRPSLARHFEQQARLLPPNSQIVVDNIAASKENVATRWHVERLDEGSRVPFTSGCSFYCIDDDGLIKSGFRVSEMVVKPDKGSVETMISSAARLVRNNKSEESPAARVSSSVTKDSSKNNIIERYFKAWNDRDIDSALECFVDQCTYQTEDPVFVDTFEGKDALRSHLTKNAAVLPESCRIVLDAVVADETNGNIGTQWHLEVGGIAIPNLRGCSMYTTDLDSGLLKSGYDVTEAPVKIPRELLPIFSLPARVLFGF